MTESTTVAVPPWAASTRRCGRGGRSTRLSPWILDPQPAALPSSSSAHLSLPPPSGPSVLVVNAGGLHLFRGRTDLDSLSSLSSALPRAGGSVRDDASVRSYFDERGGTEAAASCLALAATSPDPRVRARAADAAFANARRAAPAPGRADGAREFRPGSLYDGLVRAAGRLLRPVWHRPPVVVTEGVPARARGSRTPAKVELLLDGDALREVRSPLAALRDLMRKRFGPAVSSVPGAPSGVREDRRRRADGDGGAVRGRRSS